MPAPNKKNELLPQVKHLHYEDGMTLRAIGERLGVHEITLGKWLRGEGLIPNRSGYRQHQVIRAAKAGETKEWLTCRQCGGSFEDYAFRNRVFCSGQCTNDWQRENAAEGRFRRWCPCGKEVVKNPHQNLHCSPECRSTYGKKRQPDPANYVTFTCLNCKKDFTIPKSYTSVGKYCSNECAAKHTRIKQHIVVEDAVVLDSGYEALFWGLCSIAKLPVERAEREKWAVPVGGNGWYCPDFHLPSLNLFVETKGFEDDDDRARYAAWRQHNDCWRFLVLNRDGFFRILALCTVQPLGELLQQMAEAQRES